MAFRVSAEETFHRKDLYFGLSQAIPWITPARVFTFIHGLSFFQYKELYREIFDRLKHQLFYAVSRSEVIFVSSSKVQQEIEETFHHKKVITLPLGIPFDMPVYKPTGTNHKRDQYFMFVGMDHSVKQVDFIIKAFTIFKEHPAYKDFRLILVGDFKRVENKQLGIESKHMLNRDELKDLYRAATGYLTASFYESFNFPVLEALSQQCPVVAKQTAIIPEMKKYVYEAEQIEEYVEHMKIVAQGKMRTIRIDEIEETFNWKRTCEIITKQYKVGKM